MKRFFLLLVIATFVWTSQPTLAQTLNPHVAMVTTKGNIILELYPDRAPVTTTNFLDYVDNSFYDGLIFHRVIEDFVIQGGGYDEDLVQKTPNDPIINESTNELKNLRGTLAMARSTDPNSATSQFYINTKDNATLDYSSTQVGYCVFGRAVSGMDVVDIIEDVPTEEINSGFQDVPVTPVFITSATRLEKDLAIQNPLDAEVRTAVGRTIDFEVEIRNLGTNTITNDADPCQPFIVALYMTETEDAAVSDPCSQKLGEYSVLSLAGQTKYTNTISFNAPNNVGDHFLRTFVDANENVAEFDETNNIGTAIEFSVEPNEPELQIATPASLTINAEPNQLVQTIVEIVNDGADQAVNDFEPNGLFWTSLYQSDDPCLTAATVVADFSLTQLNPHSNHDQTLSFNAPITPGTYYLYAVADDGNNVIEPNELNNQGDTITFNVAWEPNDVDITNMYVMPGYDITSSTFMIFGNFDELTPTTAQIDNTNNIGVTVGPYQQEIPRAELTKLSSSLYLYQGSQGCITYFMMNLSQGSFIMLAQGVDLTGIATPVSFEIAISDYRGVDQVTESIVNGAAPLSFRFNQGVADMLQVTYYSLVTNRPYNTTNDALFLSGQISTQIQDPNMGEKEVTVSWGSDDFTIPDGSSGLQQIGNRSIFVYNKGLNSGKITYAYFDFENCLFRIYLTQATSLSYPEQNLTLEFDLDDGVTFDQTISVE